MSKKSVRKAKSRFHVMYRLTSVNGVPVNGKWMDYYGSARPYMQACEEAEKVAMPTSRATYEAKVLHEKLIEKKGVAA